MQIASGDGWCGTMCDAMWPRCGDVLVIWMEDGGGPCAVGNFKLKDWTFNVEQLILICESVKNQDQSNQRGKPREGFFHWHLDIEKTKPYLGYRFRFHLDFNLSLSPLTFDKGIGMLHIHTSSASRIKPEDDVCPVLRPWDQNTSSPAKSADFRPIKLCWGQQHTCTVYEYAHA
jgi:hypothetical protein